MCRRRENEQQATHSKAVRERGHGVAPSPYKFAAADEEEHGDSDRPHHESAGKDFGRNEELERTYRSEEDPGSSRSPLLADQDLVEK